MAYGSVRLWEGGWEVSVTFQYGKCWSETYDVRKRPMITISGTIQLLERPTGVFLVLKNSTEITFE
jgi:hypothetical protein